MIKRKENLVALIKKLLKTDVDEVRFCLVGSV